MRSKKRVVDGLAIPISSEIQEIMAELSAGDHDHHHDSSASVGKVDKRKSQEKATGSSVRVESVNVSSSSSGDSVDLQSIERRLKSLVHSAMNYDQK
jgi:hypothetical protein